MNRAVKITFCASFLVMIARFAPVYYHTVEFNRYVQEQTPKIRMKAPLREAILSAAEQHNIPVTEDDIYMTTSDSVLRVTIAYKVPVNFYVFKRDFSFNASGSGFLARSGN